MLKSIRKALDGPLAWVVGALIVLAFAVVGVPALDNFGNTSALTVAGKGISARDIELELRGQLQRIQAENPEVTRQQALSAGLGQQVVEVMVARALFEAEGDRMGLSAPAEVIRDYIEQIPGLQNPETGEFDNQRLGLFLQQRGISVSSFRDLIASELIRTQVAEALSAQGAAPEDLTRFLILRQFEERDIRYATVPVEAGDEAPSEDDVAAYYEANIERFQSPEYRVFSVVTLTEEDVADDITISEDELRQLYDARVGAAQAEETRTVRQFRVAPDEIDAVTSALAGEGGFDAAAAAVDAEVTTLAEQARSDFIVDAFGDAVFDAEEGGIVGPVETPFGAIIGKVTAISTSEVPSFEELREELEADLRAEIAEDRLIELVDEFEIARDEGATIAEAAQQLGLEARTTQPADAELFTRLGSIANIPGRLAAEGRRLAAGEESGAVPIDGGYGFVCVERIIPPAPLPVDEVRDQIVTAIRTERQSDAARVIEERFAALIDEGKTFQQATEELGGTWLLETIAPTDEDRPIPDQAFGRAFELKAGERAVIPARGAPEVQIVEVVSVRFRDTAAAQQLAPAVAPQFAEQLAGELNNAYLAALRETAEIKQNPSQLSRALGQDEL